MGVRFALDSLLEGAGFEPSVSRSREGTSGAKSDLKEVRAANIITNVVVQRVTALVSGRLRLRSSVDTALAVAIWCGPFWRRVRRLPFFIVCI